MLEKIEVQFSSRNPVLAPGNASSDDADDECDKRGRQALDKVGGVSASAIEISKN
ncbi:hypothetical protein J2W35_004251 [Variovorax boronicumulans]|uniref:hypothetical protein n=1 Tax=Variovorax boronicumulans TaxID=436515 RepID=UPI0027840D14|nr:hypothetical protein [Variovorax boronicumulans]MDQ0083885.1 hypothetical protein [Variovorax boronicumulans]